MPLTRHFIEIELSYSRRPVIKLIYIIKTTFLNKQKFTNNLKNINEKAYHENFWLDSPELATG